MQVAPLQGSLLKLVVCLCGLGGFGVLGARTQPFSLHSLAMKQLLQVTRAACVQKLVMTHLSERQSCFNCSPVCQRSSWWHETDPLLDHKPNLLNDVQGKSCAVQRVQLESCTGCS